MNTPFSVGNGSHLPALIKAVAASEGAILEFGVGMFSTPFLHFACHDQKRKLISFEGDWDYYKWYHLFENDYHKVIQVKDGDWQGLELPEHCGVAFIDHLPNSRRRFDIMRVANIADYIVVHDTQPRGEPRYKYSRVFPLFKYRKDFPGYPRTTVLSNIKDLSNL